MQTITDYKLIYPKAGLILIPSRFSLTEVLEKIQENYDITNEDPETIQLPLGQTIKYNSYAAHILISDGRINEEEFLKLSK